MLKIHIGCGIDLREGWINLDAYPPAIIHNLSLGLPDNIIPNSVDFIFSQHFFEHLKRSEALSLLKDCYRKLKPGGVIRTVVPDLDVTIRRYIENDLPTGGEGAYKPPSRCMMMHDAYKEWGHEFMYNASELELIHREAGFIEFSYTAYKDSMFKELVDMDTRPPDDLRIEAIK